MRRKDKQITDKKRKLDEITGLFFQFSGTYAGVRVGQKNSQKKYNIDYFGQAVNLEFKFKLNFDKEGVSKIEKKIKKKSSKTRIHGSSIKSAYVLKPKHFNNPLMK